MCVVEERQYDAKSCKNEVYFTKATTDQNVTY